MNDDYTRELNLAAKAWVDSFDQGRAGVAAADLVLRSLCDEEPTLELQLRELVTSELSYVLRADASARAGRDPVARDQLRGARPDAGEELRHAAARLDQLTSISELSSGGVDRGWPSDAATALREASRASDLLVGDNCPEQSVAMVARHSQPPAFFCAASAVARSG